MAARHVGVNLAQNMAGIATSATLSHRTGTVRVPGPREAHRATQALMRLEETAA